MNKYSKLYLNSTGGREITACVRRTDGAELSEYDVKAIALALSTLDQSPMDVYMARRWEMEQSVEPRKRVSWSAQRIVYIMKMHALEKIPGQRHRPYKICYFDQSGIRVEVEAYEDSLCPMEMISSLSTPI